VDHAVVVSMVHGGEHLPQDGHRMFWLHRPTLNQRAEAGARNKFHHEVRRISERVEGDGLDDVWVRKAVSRMGFFLEIADVLRIAGNLDGDNHSKMIKRPHHIYYCLFVCCKMLKWDELQVEKCHVL
jgi:hypothetical protein